MAADTELLERVRKLESENRKIKWAVGFLALLLATTTALAVSLHFRRKLDVTELAVRDSHGNVAARLSSGRFETCFELMGYREATNARLCADNRYGSYLSLASQNPEARTLLSAGRDVREGGRFGPGLSIQGGPRRGMFLVDVGSEAGTELQVGASTDSNAVVLSTGQDAPSVGILGSDGKVLWTAPSRDRGKSQPADE
jgi:hypothetical protein